MNSFFGVIVGVLQSILSLLSVVQQNPQHPVPSEKQVQQVVNPANQPVHGPEWNSTTSISESIPSGTNFVSKGSQFSTDGLYPKPTSGYAPLIVHFKINNNNSNSQLDFGGESLVECSNPVVAKHCTINGSDVLYVYENPGIYTGFNNDEMFTVTVFGSAVSREHGKLISVFRFSGATSTMATLEWEGNANATKCEIEGMEGYPPDQKKNYYTVATSGAMNVPLGYSYRLMCHGENNAYDEAIINLGAE
jgi:hypothetical protein